MPKLDVAVFAIHALALCIGAAFVLSGKISADAVWAAALALLAPSPIYKSAPRGEP